MYRELQDINKRPACFELYTAADLWTDEHTSSRMLQFHLNGSIDVASRKMAFIDRSVAWMVSRFGLGEGKAVADFGCGPGLYTTRFAAAGASVTGIDFSPRSIEYAKETSIRQGLSIDHVNANYLEFASEKRFNLITMIMCDYCALSPTQRQIMLEKFRTHLQTGGALLLDVYSLNAFATRQESATYAFRLLDGFWCSDPYFGFQNTFKYEPERVVLDKYTIIEPTRTRVIFNWLQYFDRETLRSEIESCGLLVEEFLGNVAGDAYDPASDELAVLVRKSPRG